jgi:gliding motility-associated-like protein
VITNVSINSTDPVNGSIYIAWSKPTEIDSSQAPGPYKYILRREDFQHPGQFIAIDSSVNLNDTIFTDIRLDTQDNPWQYRVDLMNETPGNTFLIGPSQLASSIFINLAPTDKAMKITWNDNVPWSNYRYVILRQDQLSGPFDSVGSSPSPSYFDRGLKNGSAYCYRIRSVGKYSATGFVNPIINFSQTACAIPVDNVPPCPPILKDSTDCEHSADILTWKNPYDSCSADIAKYLIYYSSCPGQPLALIDSVVPRNDTTYTHHPASGITGCYAVAAVDSVGNRSLNSDTVCVDITKCQLYRLPNVFTPNGDGRNDRFTPFHPYTSVERVDMKIYDRWGKEVFSTQDPEINWDSRDRTTGSPCSDGVYFYVCDVYEVTLCGSMKRNIHGSVTIIR